MSDTIAYGWPPAPPSQEVRLAGLILAAGKSERMGLPKALLPFHGKTFIESLVERFLEVGVDPLYVVTRREHEAALRKRLPANVRLAFIDRPDAGQLDSVRAGLTAIGGIGHGVLMGLVDQPSVEKRTLDKVIARWKETRARVVVPRYDGLRGHPMVIGRSAFPHIFRGEPESLREALDVMHDGIESVDVADPWVLLNVNLPDDYRRLIQFHGSDAEKAVADPWQAAAASLAAST